MVIVSFIEMTRDQIIEARQALVTPHATERLAAPLRRKHDPCLRFGGGPAEARGQRRLEHCRLRKSRTLRRALGDRLGAPAGSPGSFVAEPVLEALTLGFCIRETGAPFRTACTPIPFGRCNRA